MAVFNAQHTISASTMVKILVLAFQWDLLMIKYNYNYFSILELNFEALKL